MNNLKACPFCGGYTKFLSKIECIDFIETEAECTKCSMSFKYRQWFVYSKDARVSVNVSFEELYNSRVNEV